MDFYIYLAYILEAILPYMQSTFHFTACQTIHILNIFPCAMW